MGKKKEKRVAKKARAKRMHMQVSGSARGLPRKEQKARNKDVQAYNKYYKGNKKWVLAGFNVLHPLQRQMVVEGDNRAEMKKAASVARFNRQSNLLNMAVVGGLKSKVPLLDEVKRNIFSFLKK